MIEKIKKKIFISLAIAAVIYLVFTIYADYKNVAAAFAKFNWLWLPLLLLLAYLNYHARFAKWDYYLRLLNVSISKADSYAIFMSGLIMSVTPGKMGELLKAYLVKQVTKEPVSKTAPIIFAERITDFISLVLLAIIGAYVFNYGRMIVIGTGIFFISAVILISQKQLSLKIISLFTKLKFIGRHSENIITAYESSYNLLKPAPLFLMVLVSLVSWFFECFAYFLVLKNFNLDVSVLLATFVYTFSTIAGAITMLPGGLGVTEGSLTYLLVKDNVPLSLAVSSTFIIRVITLWFAVLIGIVSVSFYQRRYGKISVETV